MPNVNVWNVGDRYRLLQDVHASPKGTVVEVYAIYKKTTKLGDITILQVKTRMEREEKQFELSEAEANMALALKYVERVS